MAVAHGTGSLERACAPSQELASAFSASPRRRLAARRPPPPRLEALAARAVLARSVLRPPGAIGRSHTVRELKRVELYRVLSRCNGIFNSHSLCTHKRRKRRGRTASHHRLSILLGGMGPAPWVPAVALIWMAHQSHPGLNLSWHPTCLPAGSHLRPRLGAS